MPLLPNRNIYDEEPDDSEDKFTIIVHIILFLILTLILKYCTNG